MMPTQGAQIRIEKKSTFLGRHLKALGFVLRVILPCLIRTGRRPVIFSRYAGLGDIICTIPAARELMKRHPGSPFIYNCHADSAAIPRMAGIAERVTSLKHVGLIGHWYSFLLGGFYHFAHGDDRPDDGCHELLVTEFCRQFDVPLAYEHPELPVAPEVRARVIERLAEANLSLEKLILIHPGPSWPVREWPIEKWADLVTRLKGLGYSDIGQLGVARYLNFGKVDVASVPGTVSLVNAFSVEECIAAISMARLFIGIDSGLLHMAASARTPSVGIFGMTLPQFRFSESFRNCFVVSRVECVGCEHRKPRLHWVTGCPYEIRCMKTLAADDLFEMCLAKLGENPERNGGMASRNPALTNE